MGVVCLRQRVLFCSVPVGLLVLAGCSSGNIANSGGGGTTAASVSVTISGAADTRLGATTQFTAAVSGTANTAVTWEVNGVAGGAVTTGTISASGLFTAPLTIPSQNPVTITAVSAANAATSAALTETIWNAIPTITSGVATQTGSNPVLLLDVVGTNFVFGSALQINGASVSTSLISATELQANFTPVAGATSIAVDVLNPSPGGVASATVNVPFTSILTTAAAAARLLDQTTFGATLPEIQHVQQVGLKAYLTEQMSTPTTLLPGGLMANTAPADCTNLDVPCAEAQWWKVMLNGNDQLRQRVAFALSEIFVVSTDENLYPGIASFQNTLANDAFTNYLTIMHDVTLSEAMGAYLNMRNSAVAPAGQIANENYGREMMQLFTTGDNMLNADGSLQLDASGNTIPVYSEATVQGFAKAYTGWTWGNSTNTPAARESNTPDWYDPMVPVDSQHDMTAKTLLNGVTLPAGQGSVTDLNAALSNIFNHPNVPAFVCKQLIQHLVASNPSPAYVTRVANVFINNGSGVRGDMKAVILAILTDTEARAGDTNASFDGGHLREPILRVSDIMRGLGFTYSGTGADADYYSPSNFTSPLSEKVYASASVFNFFPPSYVVPGSTINAPEFGIENTATATLYLTEVNQMIYNRVPNFTVDLSATSPLGLMASNPANLVDALGNMFLYGQMPANMRTAIINHITTLTDPAQRVRVACFLVLTSSQYKIIH